MSHIEIIGVSKSFGDSRVLQDCRLSASRGSVLTLLGPSGCGKTTLLRIIAGFLDPDEGEVRIDGRDITLLPPNRREVGYVFQNYALFPHLTVAENVAYGLKVRRRSKAEIATRVEAALEMVALADFAGRYPARLSGGQQQRVAIARALVLEPQVLLLDEPFNALDARLRLSMQVELRKLISRIGVTAIFVTHDQAEAMTLSDQVAVMRQGRIEQAAAPLEIYDRPSTAYVATFIGRANVVPVTLRNGAVEGLPGVLSALPDGPAAMVLRPENLVILPQESSASGWQGRVVFASADGPTMEVELDAGLAEPLRAVLPRRAGAPTPILGSALRLGIADPAGCAVIAAHAD